MIITLILKRGAHALRLGSSVYRRLNSALRNKLTLGLLSSSIILVTSCTTVGPEYEAPEIRVPKSWEGSGEIQTDVLTSSPVYMAPPAQPVTVTADWWTQYQDPTLTTLINKARQINPNLQRVQARVHQAWVQRKVLRAAFFPHVDSTARLDYGLGDFNSDGINLAAGESQNQFAQIDAGWEVDLWGRIKRQVEGVNADYEASVEGYRDALIFITGEVALHYTAIRTIEARIQVINEATTEFAKIENMVRIRKEEGLSAKVDLAQTTARLKTQEAQLPNLKKQVRQLKNRLATLVGYFPGEVDEIMEERYAMIPSPPQSPTSSLPADLLRKRPDVRRAERQIAAETARVGVRVANLYPQLSISGAITFDASLSGGIVDSLKRTLGLGPQLRWRIFHACADRARIQEQEKMVEMAIKNYEATVLNAVLDVEDSFARITHEQEFLEALSASSEAHQMNAELSGESYQLGIIDLQRLLNAYRDYYFTKGETIASQGRLVAHSVKLFKALGGGEDLYNYFHDDNDKNANMKNEGQLGALTRGWRSGT